MRRTQTTGSPGTGTTRVSASATAMAKNNAPTLESQGDVPARLRRNEKCHQGTYPVVPLGGLAGSGLMTPFGGAPRASSLWRMAGPRPVQAEMRRAGSSGRQGRWQPDKPNSKAKSTASAVPV